MDGIEKSWGPNYFKFGIGYATDFKSEQRFSSAFMYRMTWLNSLGAEWRTDARIGYIDEVYTEFYQPFTPRVGVFAAPWVDLRKSPITYYLGDEWIGQYDVGTIRGGSIWACREGWASCALGSSRGSSRRTASSESCPLRLPADWCRSMTSGKGGSWGGSPSTSSTMQISPLRVFP